MSNWIPISERLPTREDADETGEVVWKWKDGSLLTAPFDDRDNSDDAPVAWLPIQKYAPPKIEESEDEVDAVVEPEPFFPKPLEQMWLKELTNMAEQYGITKETYPDLKFNKASLISILNEVSENGPPIPDGPSEVL